VEKFYRLHFVLKNSGFIHINPHLVKHLNSLIFEYFLDLHTYVHNSASW